MKILTQWLRSYLPELTASDAELAEALTLRGIAVEGVFDLTAQYGAGAGSLFETDITTNRVDAMNHYGIAREAAVIYGIPLAPLDAALAEDEPGDRFPVRIDPSAQALCGRFTARLLRGIRIEPSTGEVAERFRLLEQKQISNAVDATNYGTQAIGQPTHVFDLDTLEGGIVVRCAVAGEKLRTLDGVERTLHADDLVVADEEKALGLAGVMGGWDSMITPTTKNVLVEAAWFDPMTVRRMARRHGLHTDASHRFERGADFAAAPVASAMVSRLVLASGGRVVGSLVDVRQASAETRTVSRPAVALRMREVKRILGPTDATEGIASQTVQEILTGLGCAVNAGLPHDGSIPRLKSETWGTHPDSVQVREASLSDAVGGGKENSFAVTLPSWRLDLEREIDLLEEIARVYGYNRFRNTLPAFTGSVHEAPGAPAMRVLRATLRGAGYSEAVSSTFVAMSDATVFAAQPGAAVPLANPLSEEAGMLRPTLIANMLGMLAQNLNRGVEHAALFELGTVFSGTGTHAAERVDERPALAFGATGLSFDFFAAKGLVEAIVQRFNARTVYFDRFPSETGLMPLWLHPGRSARVVADGTTLGFFGQLHPELASARKLRQPVFLGELHVPRLLTLGLRQAMPRELSRFQPVRRDFSFLLPDQVAYGAVAEAMGALAIAELQQFAAAEVLRDPRGERVPAGEYSLLLRTVFQSSERTLREEELQEWSQAVTGAVASLGGRLRS
jgi:phenylalanyl-tRNA synthetase beta chain